MHRIVIVDDHPLVRSGLRDILNRADGLVVVGEADGLNAAIQVIASEKPHLATIDLGLSQGTGLELIKELCVLHPALRLLVVSMQDETLYAERALRAGAHGFLGKDEPPDQVLRAVRAVLSGKTHVSNEQSARMLQHLLGNAVSSNPIDSLTDRELEVFELIGRGLTTREIAEKIELSVKTIESHKANIKSKLDLPNSAKLQQRAVQWVEEQP